MHNLDLTQTISLKNKDKQTIGVKHLFLYIKILDYTRPIIPYLSLDPRTF